MKYEFILKEKISPSSGYNRVGFLVVNEVDFDNQLDRFNEVVARKKKINPNSDYLILINKLDDNGDFLEVVQ